MGVNTFVQNFYHSFSGYILIDILIVEGIKLPFSSFFASKSISNCSSIFNSKDNTSDTVSISKSMKTLILIPSVISAHNTSISEVSSSDNDYSEMEDLWKKQK